MSIWDSSFKQAQNMNRDKNLVAALFYLVASVGFGLFIVFVKITLFYNLIAVLGCIMTAMSASAHIGGLVRGPEHKSNEKSV